MTWEQFVSAVFAIGIVALTRLVNMWLPERASGGPTVSMAGDPPAAAPPTRTDVDYVEGDGPEGMTPPPPEA